MPSTSPDEFPYPSSTDDADVPADLKALADKLQSKYNAISLSKLTVPGGEGDDGKIAIVENGVVKLKAMSGDATITESGAVSIGSEKVDTPELANESVTTAKVDDGAVTDPKLASPNNSFYREILRAQSAMEPVLAAGTYLIGGRGPEPATANPFNGPVGSAEFSEYIFAPIFYFAKADYEVAGKSQKLRLRGQIATNGAKPTLKFTLGLYPLKSSGLSGTFNLAPQTVVEGSQVEINEPAATTITQAASGDFAIPADGAYALGVVMSSEIPAGSVKLLISAQLQTRSV